MDVLTVGGTVGMNAARVSYWALALLLIGFGLLSIPTVGIPFLVTGGALAALAPFRTRPTVRWPWLVATSTFFLAYVLAAPLGCSSDEIASPTSGGAFAAGDVTCTNVLGIDYTGGPAYDPPLWPAALAGAFTASVAGLATRAALVRRADHVTRAESAPGACP